MKKQFLQKLAAVPYPALSFSLVFVLTWGLEMWEKPKLIAVLFWISGFFTATFANVLWGNRKKQLAEKLEIAKHLTGSHLTDLRELSEKLEKTETELSAFFNLTPLPLVIVGNNGYFTKVNPAWEQLLGYTNEEMTSTPWADFIHPEDLARTMEGYTTSMKEPGVTQNDFVNRYRAKDGSYHRIRWGKYVYQSGASYCIAMCLDNILGSES